MSHEEFKRKTISVEEAVGKIPSNGYVYTYGCSAEPWTFLENMHLLKGSRENVTIVNFLNCKPFDYYTDDSYRGVINNESMFFNRFLIESQKKGMNSFTPVHLRNSGSDRTAYHKNTGKPLNAYVIYGTPMDKHGYISTGVVAVSNRRLAREADLVMVEINENLPYTYGDSYLHISEVDYVFPGKNQICYLPEKPTEETDAVIGKYIADLIEDRSTIQIGIGGIPNAVAAALKDKRDLGVHTEMLNDGIVQLYKAGVVTNLYKKTYPGKIVTTFTFGNKETYDFIDGNVGVLHLDVAHTNDPHVIAQNDKVVSVNTTLSVDLYGQCVSESIGNLQISGSGGQVDFVMGAKQSPGGKSIIALHSTAMVKDQNGERQRISTIVGAHPAGTIITLPRADVDFVVTEYGVAALRGAPLSERAKSLIAISHPDFRDELTAEAKRNYLL
jgi:acyl-CoA hydrolase